MKRIFLIIILFSFPMFAFSEEWIFITELDGRKHYIDSESVRDSSGFKWAKHKSQYETIQKGEDYLSKNSYKYITTNSLLAFNCSSRTLVPLRTTYFDKNGLQVHEITFTTEEKVFEGDKQWELDDNPKTFRASLIEYVCK